MPASFIRRHTQLQRTALVPEIELLLAADAAAIFEAAQAELPGEAKLPPLWAFAWPGGQALARHILDHPDAVRGRAIVDIGAGSGIASIAAAKAGARHVLAADVDSCAITAAQLNAARNGVTVDVTTDDLLGTPPPADLYLAADLVYDPELATRIAAFLETARRTGAEVWIADRTQSQRPPGALFLMADYTAPLTPAIRELPFDTARIWRLSGQRTKGNARQTSTS